MEGVVEGEGGGGENRGCAVGRIIVVEGVGGDGVGEIGDVFVAVVEVVEGRVCGVAEDEGAGGDGLGRIPDVGLIGFLGGAAELLDAEEIFVDEALEEVGGGRDRTHCHAAAKAVEGHRDESVAGLPENGAVLGIVGYVPNAGGGLDEGLITVGVVLGREVVDFGVLVEVVGGVGFALGSGTVSDVIVIVGDIIGSDEFIAGVVTILLVIDKHTATAKEGRSPL